MKKDILTVKESLEKLEKQVSSDPQEPHEHLHPVAQDMSQVVLQLQNRVAGLTTAQEALIDLLKVFEIMDMPVFDIALKNVLEFDRVQDDSEKVFEMRVSALKKKLADYSASLRKTNQKPTARRKHG
jgi:hypothetical protein